MLAYFAGVSRLTTYAFRFVYKLLDPLCMFTGANGLGFPWFIWAFEGFVLFFCILHLIGQLLLSVCLSLGRRAQNCTSFRYGSYRLFPRSAGVSLACCLVQRLAPASA